MKHTLKYIVFGALCAGLALAQSTTHTPPTPAAMAQRTVARLTKELALTSSQQAQATTIFTTEYTANQSVQASLQQAHTNLTTAIKANNTADIGTITTTIGTLQGQIALNSATASAQFYAILNSQQQSQYHMGGGGYMGRGMGANFHMHGAQ